METLKGRTALVTGASKGIGAGIAKALAEQGAAVVVNHASSNEGANRVVAEVASKGGKAVAVTLSKACVRIRVGSSSGADRTTVAEISR